MNLYRKETRLQNLGNNIFFIQILLDDFLLQGCSDRCQVQDFTSDCIQLCHNLRVHNVTEQPGNSVLFSYEPVKAVFFRMDQAQIRIVPLMQGEFAHLLQVTVDACGLMRVCFRMGCFASPTPSLGHANTVLWGNSFRKSYFIHVRTCL